MLRQLALTVRATRREIERVLHEAAVEGKEVLEQGGTGVLLIFEKKS